jgi:N-methylhydantoinase B/oxoprolinase/acetone carboxylase alpha subunit
MNDPFDGGMHLPDIFIFKPIFIGDAHVGFATTTAHHADVGGRRSGSTACDNTDVFQEGIRIPWMHLYREGVRVDEVFTLFAANVRIPRMALGDISAQIAACSVGERGLLELMARYGIDPMATIMRDLLDHTEAMVRHEIAGWPDGTATFTDYLDSDGLEERPVAVTVTVTVSGDEVVADFSECPPMVPGALNSTRSFTQAAVYHAIRCAMISEIPYTAGAFRPITVVTKPGTIAEVIPPAASSARGVTGFRMIDAVNGALAQLVPERATAAGEGGNSLVIFGMDHDGRHYIFFEIPVGTWGATPRADGNDGIANLASTAANISIETAEAEFPIVVECYGYVPDSGGVGAHRGGLAVEREWRCVADTASLTIRSDRRAHTPYGLFGGASGQPSQNIVYKANGDVLTLPPMVSTSIDKGDRFYHRLPSGGGYGPAREREPALVAHDIRQGKVSRSAAHREYLVAVDDDGAVDWDQTRALRGEA